MHNRDVDKKGKTNKKKFSSLMKHEDQLILI